MNGYVNGYNELAEYIIAIPTLSGIELPWEKRLSALSDGPARVRLVFTWCRVQGHNAGGGKKRK